ncbi:hypothetical protein BU23DRAFT_80882 [Bimuria novae-zelandiae CBS 107.79]|uniref:Uncharacterized protein n=1 Tax=Bimuria novae-zelandiae CBS 107.79 TaxID=1447943 RepID=A0A6A5VDS5_9PLEO|nr:hypothetical protein BU23DRAFT_80882 [Bimuria novae-zelandiae CBS 107.79]
MYRSSRDSSLGQRGRLLKDIARTRVDHGEGRKGRSGEEGGGGEGVSAGEENEGDCGRSYHGAGVSSVVGSAFYGLVVFGFGGFLRRSYIDIHDDCMHWR